MGPKIVAPLRDAVRLVDGEKGDPCRLQKSLEIVHEQAFGGHVDEIDLARAQGAFGLFDLRGR
jgi:hypothetical protein